MKRKQPCKHPPSRLHVWEARDDTAPHGITICVACNDCGAILRGGITIGQDEISAEHMRKIKAQNDNMPDEIRAMLED